MYIHNKVSFLYLLFFTTVISMLISGIKHIKLFAYFEESFTGVFVDDCVIQSCWKAISGVNLFSGFHSKHCLIKSKNNVSLHSNTWPSDLLAGLRLFPFELLTIFGSPLRSRMKELGPSLWLCCFAYQRISVFFHLIELILHQAYPSLP